MAQRFWVGGGSSTNFNAVTPTNWSATSGGANNASVPTTTDDVILDGNSGVGTATISANITIASIDISTYLGTLNHGAFNLTISRGGSLSVNFTGNWTYIVANSTNCKVTLSTGAVGAWNINFDTKSIQNLIFTTTSSSNIQLQSNIIIVDSCTINAKVFSNNNNITLGGTLTVSGNAIGGNLGTSTITCKSLVANSLGLGVIDSATTIVMSGGGTFNATDNIGNLKISGNLSILSDVNMGGILTINPGAIIILSLAVGITLSGDNTTFIANGTKNNTITLLSSSIGNQWFIFGDGFSTYNTNWLVLTDSGASTGTFNAFNSLDGGDNTGWTITLPVLNSKKILNNLFPAHAKSLLNYILPFKIRLNHPHQN